MASRQTVLELLEEHGLRYEQIAAELGEPPDVVRRVLSELRDRGLIEVLTLIGAGGDASAAYWRLTPLGHAELDRARRL